MTTFSIVTVVLDDAAGLSRTADSLECQTFTDFEWIVIDGGSRPENWVEPSSLKPEPNVFVSERDEGIYDAMNKGWQRATGEWILFLNAGDRLCQDRTLNDVAQNLVDSDADWAFGLVRNVDASGKVVGIQNASPFNRMGHALGNTTVPHQATFMRRNLLDRLDGFRLDCGTIADQELIYRAAIEGLPTELVWPVADFQIDGRGMQVPATRHVTCMHSARRRQADFYLGNRAMDSAATAALLVGRTLRPLMRRLQR